MAIALRSYKNTDTQALCDVWNAHQQGLAVGRITPLQIELTVLSKPYFHAEELVLLTVDETVCGFVHLGDSSSEGLLEANPKRSVLSALCVLPSEHEAEWAKLLLDHADQMLSARGAASCMTRPMPPDTPFYLGMGTGGSMMGITTTDQRTYNWLVQAGWTPRVATSGWELILDAFQPPIDRLQIQIRRNAHVDRLLDEPMLPWRQACILGHAEPTGFQLTLRAEGTVAHELLVWTVGQELMTAPESAVWLWPIEVDETPQSADRLVFLLSESLRQMAEDRVEVVRTVSDSGKTAVTSVLTRLGFRNVISGVVLEKRYSQGTIA